MASLQHFSLAFIGILFLALLNVVIKSDTFD